MSDFKAKCTKFDLNWRSAPDLAGGAYSAPADPQLYLRGLTFKEREEEDGEGKGREVKRRGREGRGGGEASLPPPNILA